ncbi:MAG: serine/threonine protein kinase [Planctomycetota bacterium]|nr:MAG: serine/threonine protein kinase [Planctomycetota bacterium]
MHRRRLGSAASGLLGERYRLLEPLGRGSSGAIYRALDEVTEREVALKLLLAGGRLSARQRERLLREGRAAAALRHPGIVAVHDCGEHEGAPYLVYELVPGGRTLADAFVELERPARLRLVLEVAQALAHAHAQGIVHRDLKAENVLVGPDGRARLTDFGLALDGQSERLTRTGELVGTPSVMAPEQIAGDRRAVGPATDVWALGVLLYEALTGGPPFEGRTLVELATAIAARAPTPPRSLDRSVSSALDALCRAALAKEPTKRPPDARAFAESLARALEEAERGPRFRVLAGLGAGAALLAAALGLGLGDRSATAGAASGPPRNEPTPEATPAPGPRPRAEPSPRSAETDALRNSLERGDTAQALAAARRLEARELSGPQRTRLRAPLSRHLDLLWRWAVERKEAKPAETELLLRLLSLQRRVEPNNAWAETRKERLVELVRPHSLGGLRHVPPAPVLLAFGELYRNDLELLARTFLWLTVLRDRASTPTNKRRLAALALDLGRQALRAPPPYYLEVVKGLTDSLTLLGRHEEELRVCEDALARSPNDARIAFRAGRAGYRLALRRSGAERVALLRQALARHEAAGDPRPEVVFQHAEVRWALADSLRGTAEEGPLREAAFEGLRRYLPSIVPNPEQLSRCLGRLWLYARDLDRLPAVLPALARIEEHAAARPRLAAWGPRIAYARWKAGDVDGAVASVERTIARLRSSELLPSWEAPLRRALRSLRRGDAEALRVFLRELEYSERWPYAAHLPRWDR